MLTTIGYISQFIEGLPDTFFKGMDVVVSYSKNDIDAYVEGKGFLFHPNGLVECIESPIGRIYYAKEMHRLRPCVLADSGITDSDLDTIDRNVDWARVMKLDCVGNFAISDIQEDICESMSRMCCGIECIEIDLGGGRTAYLAFDYGH